MARGDAEAEVHAPFFASPREPLGTVLTRMCEEGYGTQAPHPQKSLTSWCTEPSAPAIDPPYPPTPKHPLHS
jgi:hypothetical protein